MVMHTHQAAPAFLGSHRITSGLHNAHASSQTDAETGAAPSGACGDVRKTM